MDTPLKSLIRAGKELAVDPQTFDVSIGSMRGKVIEAEFKEVVERPQKRVMSLGGNITTVPGKLTYETTLKISWDIATTEATIAELKKTAASDLEEFRQRLQTHATMGDLADAEHYSFEREV